MIGTILVSLMAGSVAFGNAQVGKPAPDFSVADASGQVRKLSDYKGKHVVLEWYNKDCPYVKKHYGSGNMQKLQGDMAGKGVVWLTVISSAKGEQGYLAGPDALKDAQAAGSKAAAVLIDESGAMGKAYGAKVTPHMYLIDDKGVLRYNGAIDSNDSSDPATIAKADNYITAATEAVLGGKKVAKETSKPYGCTVKYQ